MMNLTESQLEAEGVTKGARTKIITNIQKLKDRPGIISDINHLLEADDCNVRKVLTDLEILLKSPVKVGWERKIGFKNRHDSGR